METINNKQMPNSFVKVPQKKTLPNLINSVKAIN